MTNINKLVYSLLIFTICITSCKEPSPNLSPNGNTFTAEMRQLAIDVSQYIKSEQKTAKVLAINGLELLKETPDASYNAIYSSQIDGLIIENFYYGKNGIDTKNNIETINYNKSLTKDFNKIIWMQEYLNDENNISDFVKNVDSKFTIKQIEKATNINAISDLTDFNPLSSKELQEIKNFKIIKNLNNKSKIEVIDALKKTNWDAIIIPAMVNNEGWSIFEINALKTKKNGQKRVVYCYLPLASFYRNDPFWKTNLKNEKELKFGPLSDDSIVAKVTFWKLSWRNLLFGNEESYCKYLIKQGFDGYVLADLNDFELHQ